MKSNLIAVSLMAGLALGYRCLADQGQIQSEESAGKAQDSAVHWQVDTHG